MSAWRQTAGVLVCSGRASICLRWLRLYGCRAVLPHAIIVLVICIWQGQAWRLDRRAPLPPPLRAAARPLRRWRLCVRGAVDSAAALRCPAALASNAACALPALQMVLITGADRVRAVV